MVEIGEIKILRDGDNHIHCKVEKSGLTYKIGPYEKDTEIRFKALGLDIKVMVKDDNG